MGAGNMGGGGGPKLNAKNQGAFAPGGGMGRPNPGNGGGNGMVPGLGINRDRWQGMTPQQRAGWRDMRQAGGGGAGAFAMHNMRDVGQRVTQGALAAQNAMPQQAGPMSGAAAQNTTPPQAGPTASQNPVGERGNPGIDIPAGDPKGGQAGVGAGAFAPQQRQEPRTGLGGMDANYWRQVGYTPHMVSQLPRLLEQAGSMNLGGVPADQVDYNDPRSVRRAISMLPMDTSRFSNNGRAMGMKWNPKAWGDWKPGAPYGVGAGLTLPYDTSGGGG